MPSRVLVIFVHPALEKSRVNRALLAAIPQRAGIGLRDLYELYPDFDVEVRAEQDALLAHDLIVFHHPFYWYSAPPLLKQWQDLVLQHGWAYGVGGTALRGKRVIHVTTTGGPEEAYRAGGYNNYGVAELMRPFEQTARLCGMDWLPPFVVHGTHRLREPDIARHVADYRRLLIALREGTIDLDAARTRARINLDLDALLGEVMKDS